VELGIVFCGVLVPIIATYAVGFKLEFLWFGCFCHLLSDLLAHPTAEIVHFCCEFPRCGVQGYHFLPHQLRPGRRCMYIYWRIGGGWVQILWLDIGVGEGGVSILWRARVRLRREDGNPRMSVHRAR